MVVNPETVAFGYLILKGFEGIVFEFDNLSAIETDQVIMVTALCGGFVPGLPIGKFPLDSQTQTGEKFEGAIDGRIANFRVCLNHLGVNLGQVLVAWQIEKDIEDLFTLTGRFESLSGDQGLPLIELHGLPLF